MNPSPLADDLLGPLRRVAMPRPPRFVAPGGTVHLVSRWNNRGFCFQTIEDFERRLAHLDERCRTYAGTWYAYTLMSNHLHRLRQAPTAQELGRPLRWCLTQTARAFHRVRGRRGHFWERRYRACRVEDDPYALAALRSLDRNPGRAGLVVDPARYPWSSCAADAVGARHSLITLHPTYLALSPYAALRQRRYRQLLEPSEDPRAEAREPRWTTERAIGEAGFVAPVRHGRAGRPKSTKAAVKNQYVGP